MDSNVIRKSIIVFSFIFIVKCKEDMTNIHASSYSLQRLSEDEFQFSQDLNNYASALEYHAKEVKRYIDSIYSKFDPGDDLEAYVSNPLNSFGVIKRTSYDLQSNLMPIMNNRTWIDLEEKLIDRSNSQFPTINDYYESCSSIALIQEAYSLNISDLIKGNIKILNADGKLITYKSKVRLDCETLHQIGIAAANREWYDSAHIWLKTALKRCKKGNNLSLLEEVRKSYKDNIDLHDRKLEERETENDFKLDGRLFAMPIGNGLRKNNKKGVKTLKSKNVDYLSNVAKLSHYVPLFKTNGSVTRSSTYNRHHLRDNFYSLCRAGEKIWRTPEVDMNLTCRFQHHMNPYLKLGPFMIEEKNVKPFVVLVHGFLSSHEISYFKDEGTKTMQRSRMGTSAQQKEGKLVGQTGLHRTSQQGWIVDRYYKFPVTDKYKGWDYNGTFHITEEIIDITCPEYPPHNVQDYLVIKDAIAHNVTKRIERVTKLVLDRPYASESYQVVNYGLGGQYYSHVDLAGYHPWPGVTPRISDSSKLWYSLTGDRQSTFMLYLSSPDAGGGTVFPLLGLRVDSLAGDAVFWDNMNSDGKPDYLSNHGGCPTVVGSKWVSNRWIMHYDNYQENSCQINEFQPFKTFERWRKRSPAIQTI